jgi:hypothetical protein
MKGLGLHVIVELADERWYEMLPLELECPIQVNWNQGIINLWSYWITSNSVETYAPVSRIFALCNII